MKQATTAYEFKLAWEEIGPQGELIVVKAAYKAEKWRDMAAARVSSQANFVRFIESD